MKIRYTPTAARQLVEIFDYLRVRSPSGATNVMANVRRAERLILEFPLAGLASDLPGLRRLRVPSYPYLMFYELIGDHIVIHRIRHAARKPEA